MNHIFNLQRQKTDQRDKPLSHLLRVHDEVKLPKCVDLRPNNPPIFDQGELGSCTANAGVRARMMLSGEQQMLSRLFQYYQERVIEGTISEDAGAQMRDIGKAMYNCGICPESDYPYEPSKFAKFPGEIAMKSAEKYKIGSYHSVPDLNGLRQVLALKQQPVLVGIDIYSSFESDKVSRTGVVPIPRKNEKLLGGHAVAAVGYNDIKKQVICANSWGAMWGDHGYFYLPYKFFDKGLAYDFWTLNI